MGGNKLASEFGYDIPIESTTECWVIVAHKNGVKTLLDVLEYKGVEIKQSELPFRNI